MNKFFPDWRRVLNELQRYSASGKIDAGVLVNLSESNLSELYKSLKDKNITEVRKWVVNNLDNDPVRIFRRVYDPFYDNLDSSTIPHAVVILAEYQYKSALCRRPRNKYACVLHRVDGTGEVQMTYELKDYLNAINHEKKNLMDTDDEMWEKKYPPFIINKCLAPFPDTIMLVNEMNKHHHLDKKLQFDFLLNSVRTRKRYVPWMKEKTKKHRVC